MTLGGDTKEKAFSRGNDRAHGSCAQGREVALVRKFVTASLVITMVVTLASCSSPKPRSEPEVHFASIALVSPKEVLDASQPQSRGDRAQEGVAKGGATGVVGGAAVGAIACGPFLYALCVMAAASAGVLAGTATGALYGFTGFPKDIAKNLERNVETLSREHDLQSALVGHIRQQVPPEMLAEPEIAEIQAVLTIENVEFIKEKDKVHLVSTVRVTFESTESRRVPEYGYRIFRGRSSEFEWNNWLDTDSSDLREAIKQSLLEVANKIVTVLNARWDSTAGKSSDCVKTPLQIFSSSGEWPRFIFQREFPV